MILQLVVWCLCSEASLYPSLNCLFAGHGDCPRIIPTICQCLFFAIILSRLFWLRLGNYSTDVLNNSVVYYYSTDVLKLFYWCSQSSFVFVWVDVALFGVSPSRRALKWWIERGERHPGDGHLQKSRHGARHTQSYMIIAIENGHLQWIFLLKIVIFHSYVKLPDDDMGMDQYLLIPFLVGWTSMNPSYFDVNYRGTRVLTHPHMIIHIYIHMIVHAYITYIHMHVPFDELHLCTCMLLELIVVWLDEYAMNDSYITVIFHVMAYMAYIFHMAWPRSPRPCMPRCPRYRQGQAVGSHSRAAMAAGGSNNTHIRGFLFSNHSLWAVYIFHLYHPVPIYIYI